MRVTLAPFGTASDVLPMLALAKTLQSRGHIVTICAPEEFRSRIYKCDVPMFSSGKTYKNYLECEGVENAATDLVSVLKQDMATHFVALRDGAREADVIVGARLQVAGPSMAEQRGIPYLYVAAVPAIADPDLFPVFGVPQHAAQKRRNKRIKEWNTHVLTALNRERKFSHLPPVENLFEHLFYSGPILLTMDPPFTEEKNLRNQISTGFWFFNVNIDLDPETEKYLEQGKPPVYIAPFHLKKSQEVFSLCSALMESGHRIVLGHGWNEIHENEMPAGARLLSSLSYAQLFPKMAVIVHGGAPDIAMHAIRTNVPQIIVPYTVEQSSVAERCYSAGASPEPVRDGDLVKIQQQIEQVLSNRSFAERLRSLLPPIQDGTERAANAIEKAVESKPQKSQ